MNKQVKQIKAEIERLYKEAKEEPYTGRMEGRLEALDKLDAFIDSLEEEPVSEDLEKAAVEAFKHIVDSDKNNFYEIFKAGANWQKEQMLKDAVNGEVGYWNITGLSINMKLPKCIDEDDKVKVIIVKEE